ncbi:MAG: trimeric intracellular cation channel family protein [Anaerovoracaceae bacterium]
MQFISVMEMIGTVAFAVTGAMVAIESDLDYYGIVFLAIITAVGGGIIRDVIINLDIPVSLDNPLYVIISIVTAAFVILFYKKIKKMHNVIIVCDAIGLAAFTAIGSEVAAQNGLMSPFVVITLALLTGTGGGVIRDICAREVPFVFKKEVYAVAGLLGAIGFLVAYKYVSEMAAIYISFGITLVVRLVSVKENIHLKKVAR